LIIGTLIVGVVVLAVAGFGLWTLLGKLGVFKKVDKLNKNIKNTFMEEENE